jgi:hypothetical protein
MSQPAEKGKLLALLPQAPEWTHLIETLGVMRLILKYPEDPASERRLRVCSLLVR